jgi:SNF2 family DNA or RNA helicase
MNKAILKRTHIEVTGPTANTLPFYTNTFSYEKSNTNELPITPMAYQFLLDNEVEIDEQIKLRIADEIVSRKVFKNPPKAKSPSKLYPHQRTFLRWVMANYQYNGNKLALLLADDPRLGKSIQALQAIDQIKQLEKHNGPILILGLKSTLYQWADYVNEWTDSYVPLILNGTGKQKNEILLNTDLSNVAVITNWEAIYKVDQLRKIDFFAFIGDEAHKLKARKSKVYILTKQIHAKHKLLLSATFVEKTSADWFNPLSVIRPDLFTNYWRFVGQFANITPNYAGGVKFIGSKNQEYLQDQLLPFVIQRKIADVTDLPPVQETTIKCDLSKKHTAFYKRLKKEVIFELQSGDDLIILTAIDKLIKLRQASIHPGLIDPQQWKMGANSGKLEALTDLVCNSLPSDDQIIVFSSFIKGCEAVRWALEKHNQTVSLFCGDYNELDNFKRRETKVLACTPQKAGVGLNLDNANWIIYLDQPWSTIQIRQSKNRIVKLDKTAKMGVYWLIANKTVDEYILDLLSRKFESVTQSEMVQWLVASLL